jgi:LPPG:FO 2-phospho-L-lactate transferase
MRIAALTGGVGGSKLIVGLAHVMDPRDLTVIVNTGDDIVMHGLHVSPDPDILIYTLAGAVNPETGWGFLGETFHAADGLARYGRPTWFHLGDRDLATHIHRTAMLKDGATLTQAVDSIRRAFGLEMRILPMSDEPVCTVLDTNEGKLHLQEYLIKRGAEPVISGLSFDGAARARPAPGVIDALQTADRIIICPSNPLISIGPILAVPGIRDATAKRRADVLAVSPLVGGKSLKGPSDKMMAELGYEVSALGVARMYRDICGTILIDDADESDMFAIDALGMRAVAGPTVMQSLKDKERLAREVLHALAPRSP